MKRKKRFKTSLTKLYLFSVLGFISSFIFIFLTPIFSGGSYSYVESIENEYITLGNSTRISIVKKEFNPKNEIMRLDFSLEGTTSSSNLSDITFDVISRNIKDKETHEVELIRVNDRYIVVIVKNVPKKYGVLSTTMTPKYVRPELNENNNFDGKNVKFYVNQSNKIINEDLKLENETYYKKEYISFQQLEIEKEIEGKEKGIENNQLLISDLNEVIKEMESDIEYQTEEEQFATKNEINMKETTINQYRRDIDLLKREIKELEEKSELLEKKKNDI